MKSVQLTALLAILAVFVLKDSVFAAQFGADAQKWIQRSMVVLTLLFAAVHGIPRYGWRDFSVFALLTFVISFAYETLSIYTGFPFGNYHYTDTLGLKIGVVPLLIMPAYFGMGYLSWTIAQVLLDRTRAQPFSTVDAIAVSVVASFVMVMWDLCFDPIRSTVRQLWIWHDGGAYFGVPLQNFAGWYLCVLTSFVAFALFGGGRETASWRATSASRWYWLSAVLMYGAVAAGFLVTAFTTGLQVTSLDGHNWWTSDIYAAMALVSVFTMGFVVVLSSLKLLRSAPTSAAQ